MIDRGLRNEEDKNTLRAGNDAILDD